MSIKRIFAGVTTFTCAAMMLVGSSAPAFAATAAEIQANIDAIMAQLQQYQAQLTALEGTGTPTTTAYTGIPSDFTFKTALAYGMSSNDVKYLQIILKSEIGAPTYPATTGTTGYFGSITKASVIAFQEKYASDILASWGLTKGTGYVGASTRAKLNALLAGQPPVGPQASDYTTQATCTTAGFYWYDSACHATAQGVSTGARVALSATNPAATTMMSSSAYNTVLTFDATAGTTEWKITSITLQRFGISVDSMVGGVLIQDKDGVRHGNVYSFSVNTATIVFDSAPITIAAGATQKISVLLNLGSTATSGTIGVKVTAMSGTPSGLPLVSNTFSLASGASVLGAVDVDVVSLRTTTASIDIGTKDQLLTKFKFTETTSNEDVYLTEFTIYNNGSAADGDITNWILKDPNGNTLATVAQSNDKYVDFKLASPGYLITNGNSKSLSVYVDLADGASRTTQAVVLNDYDVVVTGKSTGVNILATATSNTVDTAFPIGDIATGNAGYNHITAAAGSLTVTLSTTSPTGNVPAGGSDVVLAKYDLKAKGEDVEVRRLEVYLVTRVAVDHGDSGTTANESDDIFTGTVNIKTSDGTSRYGITVASDAPSTTATAYTLSSYPTILSGHTETISIVGNLRSDLASTDYFRFAIKNVYVKRLTTGDFQTYQATASNANTLTGAAGSLTVVKDSGWGDKSVIAGSARQVGQYVLQTGSSEGVYISTFNVDLSSVTGVNELWMQKGTGTCDENSSTLIGSVDTSVSGTNDSFSTGGSFTIPASSSQTVILCANFNQSTATGTYQTDFDAADITGTGITSGASVSSSAASSGQTLTVQTSGVLTVKAGSNPNAAVLHASETGVKVLDMKIGTLYEPIKIDTFRFTVEKGANQDRDFSNYGLKHGSTVVGSGKSAVDGIATFSGLSETIPYYGDENYSLWIDTTDALTMGASDKAVVKFASVEATGVWSNTAVLESDEYGYMGTVTTEPGSTSSVGHYKQGDLVVSINNGSLRPVMDATNEAVNLTVTGLDLNTAETFTASEEVSKFGALKQAPEVVATGVTALANDAAADFLIFADNSANTVVAGMRTADDTIDGAALTVAATDILNELTGTGEIIAGTEFATVLPVVGDFVYYYDATGALDGYGVVTTAWADNGGAADTISINGVDITAAAGDGMFAFDFDISQEAYSTASTYQYAVGDVVYHYDASGTSGWAVVTTGIKAGETMANLITSIATAASTDRIVKMTPRVIASNIMNMHTVEPIIAASTTSYSTSVSGAMQTVAIYDITAVGGSLKVKSLAVYLEGSGVAKLTTASNAFEVWQGGERIYQGGDVSGAVAATYTCTFTNPQEISAGATMAFTVKLNTAGGWANTDIGKSLAVKISGTKGQDGSGLSWYYSTSGPGTAPTNTSPATITDSELPVYGKYNLVY